MSFTKLQLKINIYGPDRSKNNKKTYKLLNQITQRILNFKSSATKFIFICLHVMVIEINYFPISVVGIDIKSQFQMALVVSKERGHSHKASNWKLISTVRQKWMSCYAFTMDVIMLVYLCLTSPSLSQCARTVKLYNSSRYILNPFIIDIVILNTGC